MTGPPDPSPGAAPGAEAVFARARELIVLGRGERAAAMLAPLLGDGGADQLTVHNLLAHAAHLVADDPGAAAEHARAVLALAWLTMLAASTGALVVGGAGAGRGRGWSGPSSRRWRAPSP